MALIDTAFRSLHLIYGGLWTGAVLFFVWRIHPLVSQGVLGVEPADRIVSGLRWLTRGGVLVFVVTGGHMAANIYPGTNLFTTGPGHVVLLMLVCWLVLTALVEMGGAKMQSELDAGRLQTAGKDTRLPFIASGVLAFVLLVLGGYLG